MKLFDFMKKQKVEEPKSKTEMKTAGNSSNNNAQVAAAPTSRELYFDDSDIGYC